MYKKHIHKQNYPFFFNCFHVQVCQRLHHVYSLFLLLCLYYFLSGIHIKVCATIPSTQLSLTLFEFVYFYPAALPRTHSHTKKHTHTHTHTQRQKSWVLDQFKALARILLSKAGGSSSPCCLGNVAGRRKCLICPWRTCNVCVCVC